MRERDDFRALLRTVAGEITYVGMQLIGIQRLAHSIVIHHTASTVDNYESIRKAHLRRGWSDAAYHLILSNGSTEVPLGHLESTWRHRLSLFSVATRSKTCNVAGLHLAVVGNFETGEVPVELRPALAHAVTSLQRRYGIPDDRIFLHRPELRRHWEFSVFLRVDFSVTVPRAEHRDATPPEETRRRYAERYVPGQRIYLESETPERHASIVIDNTDPAKPEIVGAR